jgi:hypothetical protein
VTSESQVESSTSNFIVLAAAAIRKIDLQYDIIAPANNLA